MRSDPLSRSLALSLALLSVWFAGPANATDWHPETVNKPAGQCPVLTGAAGVCWPEKEAALIAGIVLGEAPALRAALAKKDEQIAKLRQQVLDLEKQVSKTDGSLAGDRLALAECRAGADKMKLSYDDLVKGLQGSSTRGYWGLFGSFVLGAATSFGLCKASR